ncbi:Penicillin-binding protein 2 [termite gut metagenome]|uniref:Penicillin-binding protein 2 n=1 Tax=termite gut metagenome TaxID=433724 RepID=A0A5J4SUW6_9ZZZZ
MRKDYSLRRYVIGGIVLGVVFIFLLRLWGLQVMSEEYKVNADSNAFLNKIQYPSRGAMYDRNGKLLVFNQPSYDITVILREIEELDTLDFCRTLNITPAYFLKRMEDMKDKRVNPGYSKYTHQTFMTQLSAEECGVFQEKLFKFQGFYIQRRTIRQYVHSSAAHALGDIGEVSMKNIKEDDYYIRGDYIGKQGIEKFYEKYLRGEKGVEVLLRDAHGRIQGHYKDGDLDKKPVPGKNLTLGIDIELQQLAEKLMQNKLGAIVAIEPATGEILCIVSTPGYDPSILVGRQRGKNHSELEEDPLKPLFNRAIMGTYPPGSTFKTAQGLVFLQEDIINTTTTFPCYEGFLVSGLSVRCHSHASPLSFIPAVATSCNSYFCWGFYRMMENKKYGTTANALTAWKDHMVSMGFGYRMGIDMPGEQRGLIPNVAYYDKLYKGRRYWNGLRIIHTAIGQGEILLTPIQLANLATTIANRGHYITPHIVKDIEDNELDNIYRTPNYTTIAPQNYEYVVEGMRRAVTGGTCRRANIPGIEVCGKTGMRPRCSPGISMPIRYPNPMDTMWSFHAVSAFAVVPYFLFSIMR